MFQNIIVLYIGLAMTIAIGSLFFGIFLEPEKLYIKNKPKCLLNLY